MIYIDHLYLYKLYIYDYRCCSHSNLHFLHGFRPIFPGDVTIRFTVSDGMAKPTPAKAPEGLAIIVFTPYSQSWLDCQWCKCISSIYI